MVEWNGGAMIRAVTSQQEGPMFESNLKAFLCETGMFSLCPCGYSSFLLQSKYMHEVRLPGEFKLTLAVSVNGCLSVDRSAASCPMGQAPTTHWILPFIIKQEHRNIDGREENMN